MIAYLHGFASGPQSSKAVKLAQKYAALGVHVERVDMTPGEEGFERSSPSSMLSVVEALLAKHAPPHALFGSSLGGYLAALAASRDPGIERLVLLAPAFGLSQLWRKDLTPEQIMRWRREPMEQMHYASNRLRKLHYGFLEDADRLPQQPVVKCPTLVISGERDVVVPLEGVRKWVERTPGARLVTVDDEHELSQSVERIFEESRAFLAPWLAAHPQRSDSKSSS